ATPNRGGITMPPAGQLQPAGHAQPAAPLHPTHPPGPVGPVGTHPPLTSKPLVALKAKREQNAWLGAALGPAAKTAGGKGWFQRFQNGSIYWSQATGASEVHGAIAEKWAALGSEQSVLGFPVTDELTTPDTIGRFNHFQNGSIYWSPDTGAFEVHGAIRDKWESLGWEQSFLGYPITDE